MTSSTSASRPWAAPVGALAAAALLGFAVVALLSPEPSRAVTPTLDSLEDCAGARVVLLGNSKTRSDLPAEELAAFLDLRPGEVAALTVHGSSAPVWYAVNENLVFARGCRPETVVAYGTLDKLLAADVAPDERVRLLGPVMRGDEPALRRKVFGESPARLAWNRARARAVAWREAFLARAAAAPVGLLSRGRPGRALLDEASEAAFGAATLPPGRSVAPPASAVAARLPRTVEDSFLPDLLATCAAHGARLVVVRAPLRDAAQEDPMRRVPGLVEGARAAVEAGGGRFVDLHDLALPPAAWQDGVHLGALGASRVASGLARALQGGAEVGVSLLDRAPRYAAGPPGLAPPGRPVAAEEGRLRLPLAGRLPLSDEACTEHEVARCCSPVELLQDGRALARAARAELAAGGGGRFRHEAAGLLVAPLPGAAPRFEVALATDRWCGGWWLYPGDRALLELPAGGLLEIAGRASEAPPRGALAVTALRGGEILASERRPIGPGVSRWPLPPGSDAVELATDADASFFLLTHAVVLP